MARKGKPADVYQPGQVGKAVQANFQFLTDLFGAKHQALRDKLFNCADEAAVRKALGDHGVTVQPPVRIMIVDIENARTKTWGQIDPETEEWYVLVMPPVPRRKQNADYADMQAWSAAWYHASNDGYGM